MVGGKQFAYEAHALRGLEVGKMRILLVEDNSDHRELMRLALTGHDSTWEVESVASGEEALCHLAEVDAYDVVFLDYSLPGRDGLEVLEEIRRGEAPPPVVVVTGRGDVQVAVKAMKCGAYDYVIKGEGYLQRVPVVAHRAVEAHQLSVERKRAEEELRTSRLQLRALAARLQQIREYERIVIAREIHDEMGGGLTGLKMDISWLLRKMGDADLGEARVALMDKIHTSNALIDHMIHVVRRISTDLRPSVLDDLGLIAALEWQLSEFTSRTEIPHEFATAFEYVNIKEDRAVAVFRIFQEALTNVARHSRATKVAVVLREGERSLFGDENLVLEIRDNGRGITEEEILNPESFGLLGMKERVLAFGGELSIRGEPGGGTALVLKMPRKQGEQS